MLLVFLIYTAVVVTATAQINLTPFGNATQGPEFGSEGKPENAVNPPISNVYNKTICTKSWTNKGKTPAWWMFKFSFGTAYITDITIYYRENYEIRMDGFQLFVTNTSSFPPKDYSCFQDKFKEPYPITTQTIPCNTVGQYVIYYDLYGSDEHDDVYEPIVELCYVAINGCQKGFWGSDCSNSCPEYCVNQHCYLVNGSCVWGCTCWHGICNEDSEVCIDGCMGNRTGRNCNKYNLAIDGLVSQSANGIQPASQVNDGIFSMCYRIKGSYTWLQVDIQERSIVREIFMIFGVNTTQEGNHTFYASNNTGSWENGTVLYSGEPNKPTEIKINEVFRLLIYIPPRLDHVSEVEVCEIGIAGCPPTHFGVNCSKPCPVKCSGPCDLETGQCKFGCLIGWRGQTCELNWTCFSETLDLKCDPDIYQIYPSSGPVNGGTLLTISGNYLGNVNDSISVYINGIKCNNVTGETTNAILTCVTGKGNTNKTNGIFVSVNANSFGDPNSTQFSFKEPSISEFSPKEGIVSGGTTVVIRGADTGFEGQNRYNISFCDNDICIECSVFQNSPTFIRCKTGKSEKDRNMTMLQVVIDDLTVLTLNETFRYLWDSRVR